MSKASWSWVGDVAGEWGCVSRHPTTWACLTCGYAKATGRGDVERSRCKRCRASRCARCPEPGVEGQGMRLCEAHLADYERRKWAKRAAKITPRITLCALPKKMRVALEGECSAPGCDRSAADGFKRCQVHLAAWHFGDCLMCSKPLVGMQRRWCSLVCEKAAGVMRARGTRPGGVEGGACRCGAAAVDGRKSCASCLEYGRARYRDNRAAGRCTKCSEPAANETSRCLAHGASDAVKRGGDRGVPIWRALRHVLLTKANEGERR